MILWLQLFAGTAVSQVILTEIMFDADTLENHNEYVEIFNMGSQAVNLQGWQIGDSLKLDGIADAGHGLLLQPQQFAVIMDSSYFQNSTTYDTLIPSSALIVKIDAGSFGQYGWSNSYPEPVYLVNPQSDTVQSYRYTLDNEPGYSDEKILMNEDNSSTNWTNSTIFRGTPGRMNSVTPSNRDLSLDSAWVEPRFPVAQSPFMLWYIVRNSGLEASNIFDIVIFNDLNGDRQPDLSEILAEQNYEQALEFGDTLIRKFRVDALTEGDYKLGVLVKVDDDDKPANNLQFLEVRIEPLENPIVINEIMYRPRPGWEEWVEIFNSGESEINISGWAFADARDTVVFQEGNLPIAAGAFLVLGGDSAISVQYNVPLNNLIVVKSFPTLNNDEDDLKLISSAGRLIDRVTYSSSWMGRDTDAGISLERINPQLSSQLADNWAASADPNGSTPAARNSLYIEKPVTSTTVEVHPNPFSPDGDGFEDFTLLQYNMPAATAFMTIDIFDMAGRRIRRLADQAPIGRDGSFIWDGKDKAGRIARMGIYIFLIRIFNNNQDLFEELKSTVVLMKR